MIKKYCSVFSCTKIMLSEISSILNLLTHQWLCKLSFISLRKGGVNGKNKTVCWKRGMWMNGHCFQTCILIECLFVDIYETYAIQNWYWIFYMKFETWRNLLEENIRFNTLDYLLLLTTNEYFSKSSKYIWTFCCKPEVGVEPFKSIVLQLKVKVESLKLQPGKIISQLKMQTVGQWIAWYCG